MVVSTSRVAKKFWNRGVTYLVCQRVPWRRHFPFRNSSRRGVGTPPVTTGLRIHKICQKQKSHRKRIQQISTAKCEGYELMSGICQTRYWKRKSNIYCWWLKFVKNYLGFKKHHILRIINWYRDSSHQRCKKSIGFDAAPFTRDFRAIPPVVPSKWQVLPRVVLQELGGVMCAALEYSTLRRDVLLVNWQGVDTSRSDWKLCVCM